MVLCFRPSDETCSSLSHRLHLSQPLDHQGPTEARHCECYCEPLAPNVGVDSESPYPLVFAPLENTEKSAHNGCGTCACDVDNVRQTVPQSNHRHICPSCRMIRDEIGSETSDIGEALEQEMVDSFNVLRVSSPTCAAVAVSQHNVHSPDTSIIPPNPYQNDASKLLCRTCRQEVCAPSLLDDTTVDDLAGYLDQIVFLPKPMSEMAELMYT